MSRTATSAAAVRRTPTFAKPLLVLLAMVLMLASLTVVAWAPVQAAPAPAVVAAKVNFGPSGADRPARRLDQRHRRGLDRRCRQRLGARGLALRHPHAPGPDEEHPQPHVHAPWATLQSRTFIHMQSPSGNTTNTNINGAWEYNVPAGQYKVEVGYGDANPGADPESHTLNVEGTSLVRNDPAPLTTACTGTSPLRVRAATGWVTVTDGKLTVDALGGTNTKLAWITIDSVPVAGLTAQVLTPTSIALDWADVDGVAGYKVWRTEVLPTPSSESAQVTLLGSPTASEFTDSSAVKGVLYSYSVGTSATVAAINGSVVQALGDDATPQRPALPLKVNFQDRAGATPTGYVADFGRGYSNARGYGWVHPGTQVPLSIVGNGRTRTADGTSAAPLNTMIHAQYQAARLQPDERRPPTRRLAAGRGQGSLRRRGHGGRRHPRRGPHAQHRQPRGHQRHRLHHRDRRRHRQHRCRPLQDRDDQRAGDRRLPDPGHHRGHQHEAHPPVGHARPRPSTRSPTSRPASPRSQGTAPSPSTGPTTPRTRTTSRATTSTAARPPPSPRRVRR